MKSPVDTGRITCVPLSKIRLDAAGRPRFQTDPDQQRQFRDLYADGGLDALPPLDVVADGAGGYLLADGRHRYGALQQLGAAECTVRILLPAPGDGPVLTAFERGLVTAATSSLRLTRAEKHAAVVHLKQVRPQLTDREIARQVGVSHQTVGRVLAAPRSNGPDGGDGGGRAVSSPSALDAARTLFRGLEKVHDARGLGLWDALTRDHTGDRLAGVFRDVYGEQARDRAERFAGWLNDAAAALREDGQ